MFCSSCGKEISEGISFCPYCGFSLKAASQPGQPREEELKSPLLPSDLSLGKALVNWGNDTFVTGEYLHDQNIVKDIPDGKVQVFLHQNGIKISSTRVFRHTEIHSSQIIDVKESKESELVQVNKSVIGRAVVGAVLFGPFAGIIGGMSGIGTKTKRKDSNLLIISYWDVVTRQPLSIIITTEKPITPFVLRWAKERQKAS